MEIIDNTPRQLSPKNILPYKFSIVNNSNSAGCKNNYWTQEAEDNTKKCLMAGSYSDFAIAEQIKKWDVLGVPWYKRYSLSNGKVPENVYEEFTTRQGLITKSANGSSRYDISNDPELMKGVDFITYGKYNTYSVDVKNVSKWGKNNPNSREIINDGINEIKIKEIVAWTYKNYPGAIPMLAIYVHEFEIDKFIMVDLSKFTTVEVVSEEDVFNPGEFIEKIHVEIDFSHPKIRKNPLQDNPDFSYYKGSVLIDTIPDQDTIFTWTQLANKEK